MKNLLFATVLLFSLNSFAAVTFEGSKNGDLEVKETEQAILTEHVLAN